MSIVLLNQFAVCGLWSASLSVTFMCWSVAAHLISISSSFADRPASSWSRVLCIFILMLSTVSSSGFSKVWLGSAGMAAVAGLSMKMVFTTLYSVLPVQQLNRMRYGQPRQKIVTSQNQTELIQHGILSTSVHAVSLFSNPATVFETKKSP